MRGPNSRPTSQVPVRFTPHDALELVEGGLGDLLAEHDARGVDDDVDPAVVGDDRAGQVAHRRLGGHVDGVRPGSRTARPGGLVEARAGGEVCHRHRGTVLRERPGRALAETSRCGADDDGDPAGQVEQAAHHSSSLSSAAAAVPATRPKIADFPIEVPVM